MNAMTLGGVSTSTANMPLYIDFYLLLDNSPSMGVGATPADVTTMVNNTPDQCAFACHDAHNSNNYYNLAKTLGVTMRIDVLRTATQQLMDTAAVTETYSNQFRMAIYDFGVSSDTAALTPVFCAVIQPDERQDRGRHHRPDDGQRPKRQQRPGHRFRCHSSRRSTRAIPSPGAGSRHPRR